MPPGTSPGVAALQCHPVSPSQCWVITCAPRAVLERQDGAPLPDPPLCRGSCWNPPSCTQSGPARSPPSLGDTWLMPLAGQVGLWQVPEGTEPAEPAGPGGGGRGRGGEGGGGPAGSLLLPEPPLGTSLRALIVTRHKDVSSCQWLSHGTMCSSGAPLASQQPHCGIPEGCSGLATALQHPRGPPWPCNSQQCLHQLDKESSGALAAPSSCHSLGSHSAPGGSLGALGGLQILADPTSPLSVCSPVERPWAHPSPAP